MNGSWHIYGLSGSEWVIFLEYATKHIAVTHKNARFTVFNINVGKHPLWTKDVKGDIVCLFLNTSIKI